MIQQYTLLLRLTPRDLYSACPLRQFHPVNVTLQTQDLRPHPITVFRHRANNRQNKITAIFADSHCIEDEVPGYCPPNCAIIVRADPGARF